MLTQSITAKRDAAVRSLREAGSVLVALSGGVDSAVLLALAVRALGTERVAAATGHSASLAAAELDDARAIAASLGVRHFVVETHEGESEEYRRNDGTRCYHCRDELFRVLGVLARREGFAAVAYGAIADDAIERRPGMRAATEHRILAPLTEAGLGKSEIRALAAETGLDVTDKPASGCLASRIPVGTVVTPERLARIESAEAALRRLGLVVVRVRDHDEIARIETDERGQEILANVELRRIALRDLRDAGFRFVVVDLEGYRPGGGVDGEAPSDLLYRIGPKREGGQ